MIQQLRSWWHERGQLNANGFVQDQQSFRPAALALQENPPAPLPRMIAYTVVTIFISTVVWACLSRVDIVSSADGKIIPAARVKVIQPLEKAVVKEILVAEGDVVKAGDALILLDKTFTQASVETLAVEREYGRKRLAAYQAVLRHIDQAGNGYVGADECDDTGELSVSHRQWCAQRIAQYHANLGSLKARLQEIAAEQKVSQNVVRKLERTLPLTTEHASALATLLDKKVVSRVQFLDVERERIQQEEDLSVERNRQQVFDTRKAELREQIAAHKSQTQSQLLEQINDLKQQEESLSQELNKARALDFHQTLLAPVDGVVQQLTVSTVGQIVTPAQELMLIVPEQEQREVEVMLANKDIGFVFAGQKAEIKIHTFPFTRYGVIDAEVLQVSEDAVNDEKLGLVFPVRLALGEKHIAVGDRHVPLKPGMSVTAEIKTGKRRLIEFFLSPVLKSGAETARER